MRTGIIAVTVVILVAVALFGALEALPLPVSCTTEGNVLVDQTTSVASTVTTTTEAQIERAANQTDRVYNFNPRTVFQPTLTTMPGAYLVSPTITITPNQYVYQDVALTAGMDVQVSWIANNTVDAYVFNTTENAVYANSNATTTSPNIASSLNSEEGSLSFHVSVNDVYFLAFFDPHNGAPWPGPAQCWAVQRDWHGNIPGNDQDLSHPDHDNRRLCPPTGHLNTNHDQQLQAHR